MATNNEYTVWDSIPSALTLNRLLATVDKIQKLSAGMTREQVEEDRKFFTPYSLYLPLTDEHWDELVAKNPYREAE